MPVHKVKSRVQAHGRPRAGKVPKIQEIATALSFPRFDSNKITPGANRPVKKRDVRRKPAQTQPAFTLGGSSTDSSEEAVYDDTDEEIEPEQLVIRKQFVPSIKDQQRKGLLTSALAAAIPKRHAPPAAHVQSVSPIEDNSAEDPSASMTLDTPAYAPEGEMLQEAQPSSAEGDASQGLSKPDANPASRSFLQTLVELFAGRRKPAKIKQTKRCQDEEPIFDETRYGAGSEDEAQAASDRASYTAAEPHLTLPQVIPDGQNRGASLVRRGNTHIPLGCDYRVNAAVQPDKFTPEKITRGFDAGHEGAPITPPTTPPLAPLAYRAHKQGNSAAKLLDRDNKTWAGWHDKNPTPSKMPFAKQPSTANLNRGQAETKDFANGDHSGPHYLKHTGDAYPCSQGKCW